MSLFWNAVLWLFIGLFIGASLGVVIAGLCAAAGREPDGMWIPVSERLPEDSGRYICAIRYNEEPKKMWVEQRFWNIFGWDMYTSIVTHWMPLPEPPEATDADN